MNCFNIRELQSILKRKFFTDLINTHDHRDLLEQSMIGLRYKTNNNFNLNPDVLSFYNFGLTTSNLNKTLMFTNVNASTTTLSLDNYNYFFINLFNKKTELSLTFSSSFYVNTICEYLYLSLSFNFLPSSLFSINTFFTALFNNLSICFDLSNVSSLFSYVYTDFTNSTRSSANSYQVQDTNSELADAKNAFLESSDSTRYNRFFNILVNYDYKTGHYIGNWEQQYPFLYTSFIEVARGIRKPS
jgi:hypothetical protein